MRDHKKTEHPRKQLKCEECDETFKHKCLLERHISIKHKNEKNYICDVENCGNKYSTKYALNYHIETFHGGIRKFKCESCGKAFATNSERNGHVTSVHEKLKNQVCSIVFFVLILFHVDVLLCSIDIYLGM